jgi:hypothetical protein
VYINPIGRTEYLYENTIKNYLKTTFYGLLVIIILLITSCNIEITIDLPQCNLIHSRIKTRVNDVIVVIHSYMPEEAAEIDAEKISSILNSEIISSHPDQYQRITVRSG